ncbi:MAG: MlaA family lipoprotein, partial [Pseudomonadota bacterium]
PEQDTDFGETLHVWGVSEGDYLELPLLGPSTTRDFLGTVVDFLIDPLNPVIDSPESYYALGARGASGLNARNRFGDSIDSVLYESADSYAQARLIYLQNRRFELSRNAGEAGIDTTGEIYDDLFFE